MAPAPLRGISQTAHGSSVTPPISIAVIGLGDLGRRIVLALTRYDCIHQIVIIGRREPEGFAFARLASACGFAEVRFLPLNVLHEEPLCVFIEQERPTLIVQCGSLLSPWFISEVKSRASFWQYAGFILQLAAQLPIITNLMRAVRQADYAGPVVNCSYPDVTHPILSRIGLAPTIGIGNSGMIHNLLFKEMLKRTSKPDLRVFAHHSQVRAVMRACELNDGIGTLPKVYCDNVELSVSQILGTAVPIPLNRELNALSAAHASQVILGLTTEGQSLHTSAPGPLGLPGGWPVSIENGRIDLNLPTDVTSEEIMEFQIAAAKMDGLERIDDDGTVHVTEQLKELVPRAYSGLTEPLHPDDAISRAATLIAALQEKV